MSTLLCAVALAATVSAGQSTGARSYDPITDTTSVTLASSSVVDKEGKPTGFTLRVFGSFAGEDEPRDAMISLGLISVGRTWNFSGESETIELMVDGRLVKVGPLRNEWTTMPDGTVFQQIWAEVTPLVALGIAGAQTVDARLGTLGFVLTREQRQAMRALATELSAKK